MDHSRVLMGTGIKNRFAARVTPKTAGTKTGNGCSASWAADLRAAAQESMQGRPSAGVPTCGGPGQATFLSWPRTSVAAGATSSLTFAVRSTGFQGRALKLSKSIASAFVITSVKVGNKEMLDIDASDNGFIPGEFFSTENQDCGLLPFCPAPTSQVMVITVTNITGAAVDFLGGIEGATW